MSYIVLTDNQFSPEGYWNNPVDKVSSPLAVVGVREAISG